MSVPVDGPRNDLIWVTGGHGMVGRSVLAELAARGWTNVIAPPRGELDLLDLRALKAFIEQRKPRYLMHLAARVGGIGANMADPFGFLAENTAMATNVMTSCIGSTIRRILVLGSSCVYPRDCPQPMKEEYLLTGPLEPTNEGYALSKIVALRLAQYIQSQTGITAVCPMPCNIYGTHDHFDLERSHVLSALVRRFVDARKSGAPTVTLWGTGVARREFIHVFDVARAIVQLFETHRSSEIINVGTGVDVTIRELAGLVADASGYPGEVSWDPSKPDGMPRKCLDVARLSATGFKPRISLAEGVSQTIREYEALRNRGSN